MIPSPGEQKTGRLLLIEPPFYRLYGGPYALVKYPLSLAHLALAVRERTAWDVRVFNADFAPLSAPFDIVHLVGEGFSQYTRNLADPSAGIWQTIRSVLGDWRPSVVGISVKSSGLAAAYRIAGIVKELNPAAVVVAGGPHPSATGPEMLGHTDVDICVAGEGEETLCELLLALEKGTPLRDVKGLFFRSGEGHEGTGARAPLADLDALGFPFRQAPEVLIGYEQYPPAAFGHLFATRGCPHSCLFCGSREIWGRKPRFRSPRHVAAEIALLQERGVPSFHFDDDTFGVNDAYLEELCLALEELRPRPAWSCEIHVGLVTEKNIALMKRAGCTMIQLGIESGNDAILRHIRKGFTLEKALEACRLIVRQGIRLHTFFMAGFPWETEATLRDTQEVIEKLACEKVIYSLFTPYPGTEAFRLCRARGLIPADYDSSLFGHQSPLNHFSLHLSAERFRALSGEIEAIVVTKNRLGRKNGPPDRP